MSKNKILELNKSKSNNFLNLAHSTTTFKNIMEKYKKKDKKQKEKITLLNEIDKGKTSFSLRDTESDYFLNEIKSSKFNSKNENNKNMLLQKGLILKYLENESKFNTIKKNDDKHYLKYFSLSRNFRKKQNVLLPEIFNTQNNNDNNLLSRNKQSLSSYSNLNLLSQDQSKKYSLNTTGAIEVLKRKKIIKNNNQKVYGNKSTCSFWNTKSTHKKKPTFIEKNKAIMNSYVNEMNNLLIESKQNKNEYILKFTSNQNDFKNIQNDYNYLMKKYFSK